MNPRTLSAYAQRALENARTEAVRLGHDAIGAEHIVLGLLRGDGTASALFGRLGVASGLVEQRLEASGRRRSNRGPGEQLAYTSHAKRLIEVASKEARETGSVLSAEHLLLAALHEPRGALVKILADAGVSADRAQAAMRLPAARADLDRVKRTEPRGKRSVPWRALLLLAVPLSIVLERVFHAPALAVFSTACLGCCPWQDTWGKQPSIWHTAAGPPSEDCSTPPSVTRRSSSSRSWRYRPAWWDWSRPLLPAAFWVTCF